MHDIGCQKAILGGRHEIASWLARLSGASATQSGLGRAIATQRNAGLVFVGGLCHSASLPLRWDGVAADRLMAM